jgi:hypothetical protein
MMKRNPVQVQKEEKEEDKVKEEEAKKERQDHAHLDRDMPISKIRPPAYFFMLSREGLSNVREVPINSLKQRFREGLNPLHLAAPSSLLQSKRRLVGLSCPNISERSFEQVRMPAYRDEVLVSHIVHKDHKTGVALLVTQSHEILQQDHIPSHSI